ERPVRPDLLGGPPIKGGAVLYTRCVDRLHIRLGAPREHAPAGAQCGDHSRDQLVRLGQARSHRWSVFVEGALNDFEDPVELNEELCKCAIATSGCGWTLGQRGESPSSHQHRLARPILETLHIALARTRPNALNEI